MNGRRGRSKRVGRGQNTSVPPSTNLGGSSLAWVGGPGGGGGASAVKVRAKLVEEDHCARKRAGELVQVETGGRNEEAAYVAGGAERNDQGTRLAATRW